MNHAKRAETFNQDKDYAKWHDQALWFVRAKRDKASRKLPEWEALRERAAAIKSHTLTNIAEYLEQFEQEAKKKGIHVHWAQNAEEHNKIVLNILQKHGAKHIVKSKSMLTEECHLNPYLEKHGLEIIDTDLGERIVQLRKEPPSHIVLPAIHLKREHVSDLFHKHLGTDQGNAEPKYLTEAARQHLRQKFLKADAGITGVNFAIAETGGIVTCTNEGNADLGASLPKLHIACMGLEKVIPKLADLSVFLRLLARSATGQSITSYSSLFHQAPPDGQMHVIILDNGRSKILTKSDFVRSLQCIRCGACMNTCPVFRRSGGHSYNTVVPGPIGSVLSPHQNIHQHQSLPFASTLCGSCTDVCPVKINLHDQLLAWRKVIAEKGVLPYTKVIPMKIMSIVFRHPRLYQIIGKFCRTLFPLIPRLITYNQFNTWGRQRELPPIPKHSFKELYKKRKRE